jgi:hypothetical protein
MRFGTLNVRSLYRAGSLMTDEKDISEYKLYLVDYRRSDGTEVAPNQQENVYISLERGMKIMN